jgi:signal transduction histidine kinase
MNHSETQSSKSNKFNLVIRLGLPSVATLLYILMFPKAYQTVGTISNIMLMFPIVITAWLFGLYGSLIAAILSVCLNTLLLFSIGENPVQLLRQGGIIGMVSMTLIGVAIGWLSTLVRKVRQQSQDLALAHENLRIHTLELEEGNAELDAFAHTVAHDLKAPLSVITGHSALLKMRLKNMPMKAAQNLDIITQTTHQMSNIIDELMLFASVRKTEAVNLQPLAMHNIVTRALERLTQILEKTQAEVVLPNTWPVTIGYAAWIEQVWVNYVSNALKYGGNSDENIPPCIELGANLADSPGYVRFWVKDNGRGLTQVQQAILFTQFTRLHQVHVEGHGLGLSIVRRIIRKLGGTVGIESEIGKGSTFYFTLPTRETIKTSKSE